MFTTIESFKEYWGSESANTSKMMAALTDESLNQQVGGNLRTLGRLAWHIVITIPEMMGRTGLKVVGPAQDAPVPKAASEIGKAYDQVAKSLLEQIASNWKDETLKVKDDMYGEQWARSATLGALVVHEVHHRGQMTVLMRQAGLKVPGIYGPSYEEWTNYGMKPPAV